MNIERELIIKILKLTRNGSILNEQIYKHIKVPRNVALKLLKNLERESLIYFRDNLLEANSFQRLRLAVYAVQLGADLEYVCSFLGWREFERVAVMAFERNSYEVVENVRFKHVGRRWEIDVVGFKKPLVVCVDCKRWRRGMYPSTLKKIVEKQVERTFAFAESLNAFERFSCAAWGKVKVVPAVLSIVPGRFKFYGGVPVVPIFQLQDFLNQLPVHVDKLKYFGKSLYNKFNGCS